MSSSFDLAPIPANERNSTTLDVALLFAGANVVTSTLIAGATLSGMPGSLGQLALLAVVGIVLGTLPIAILARLGPRTGLPTMVLLRDPFGSSGAAAISGLLVLTNFAWIALNNVVAAQAMAAIVGGREWIWSVAVGAVATLLALGGERVMALFDRVAVPLLAVLGLLMTWKVLAGFGGGGGGTTAVGFAGILAPLLALDLVIGYQISWSLMFADYTRFQRRAGQATRSVLLGLTASSVWLVLLGLAAARAGSGGIEGTGDSLANDPTSLVLGLGLPVAALGLVALSTITTNFVNLYLSALATRNLVPQARPVPVVLGIGIVGTGLGIVSGGFLDRFAEFMGVLATLLLPIVAIALVHFFVARRGAADEPAAQAGETEGRRWGWGAVAAWIAGCAVYQGCVFLGWGATLPTLLTTAAAYWLARGHRVRGGRAARPLG